MAARRFDASYCDRMLRLSVSVGSSASSVRLYLSVVVCVCLSVLSVSQGRFDWALYTKIEGRFVPGRTLLICYSFKLKRHPGCHTDFKLEIPSSLVIHFCVKLIVYS